MREVFQQELREVQDRLVEIASLVASLDRPRDASRSTSRTSRSPRPSSPTTARSTALALELDELAINILARQQPVARDLRIVVSALRISASLERMGDMSEHIAQLARYRFPDKVVPKSLRRTFAEHGRARRRDRQEARRTAAHRRRADRRRHPQRGRQGGRARTSASSTRCSARPGRARPSTRSTPPWPRATTSASPTTRSRSPRRCSTWRPATGCRKTRRRSAAT